MFCNRVHGQSLEELEVVAAIKGGGFGVVYAGMFEGKRVAIKV